MRNSTPLRAMAWAAAMVACSERGAGPGSAEGGVPDAAPLAEASLKQDAFVPPRQDASFAPPCNGSALLCERRYDDVTHLTTRHSAAAGASWAEPTQNVALSAQLASAGVRGITLELRRADGALSICAGDCSTASVAAGPVLEDIVTFLRGNPRDVITLLVWSYVPAADVARLLGDAGLSDFAHVQPREAVWPTLSSMIQSDRRLVVFVDERAAAEPAPDGGKPEAGAPAAGDAAPELPDAQGQATASGAPWLHPWRDWFWETSDVPTEVPLVDCVPSRGSPRNPLIQLNHLLSSAASGQDARELFHTPDAVAARLDRCRDDRGRLPTLLVVDFADVGDPNGGVQIASGLR